MEVAHRPELRALTSKGVLAKEHFKIINNLEHNLVMGVGSVKEAEVSKPQEWSDPKKRERQFKTNKIIIPASSCTFLVRPANTLASPS